MCYEYSPPCVVQVYVFNRDAQSNLTISSPLEAHKTNTLNLAIVGVDAGCVGSCLGPVKAKVQTAPDDLGGIDSADQPNHGGIDEAT